MSNNNTKYISLFIKIIDIKYGNLINNYIINKNFNFNIEKKNNNHNIILTVNDKSINIDDIIKYSYEKMIIISHEEYIKMLKLFYNDDSLLVNYNNNYFILEIKPNLIFNTTKSNIDKIENTFKNFI